MIDESAELIKRENKMTDYSFLEHPEQHSAELASRFAQMDKGRPGFAINFYKNFMINERLLSNGESSYFWIPLNSDESHMEYGLKAALDNAAVNYADDSIYVDFRGRDKNPLITNLYEVICLAARLEKEGINFAVVAKTGLSGTAEDAVYTDVESLKRDFWGNPTLANSTTFVFVVKEKELSKAGISVKTRTEKDMEDAQGRRAEILESLTKGGSQDALQSLLGGPSNQTGLSDEGLINLITSHVKKGNEGRE